MNLIQRLIGGLLLSVTAFIFCIPNGFAEGGRDAGARPSWITLGKSTAFPLPQYIQGVGLAKERGDAAASRLEADQNAFSEIVRQISAEVSSEIAVEKTEITSGGVETLFEKTSAGTKIRSSIKLEGLTIVERHYDQGEKTFYSLGVLDRVSASEPALQELQRLKADYERTSKSAAEYRNQGKVFQSLLSLRDAYQAAYGYQEKLPFYQMLAGHMGEIELDDAPPSPTATLERFTGTLAHLEFQIASGDRQTYVYNKPLTEPLVTRLRVTDGTPTSAEGFPISFRFQNGRGQLTAATSVVDMQGTATALVSQIERSGDRECTVIAEIAFHELRSNVNDGGVWNSKIPLETKKVVFAFSPKKASGSTGVLILVSEKGQYWQRPVPLREALAIGFSQAGFKPVTESEFRNISANQVEQSLEQHLEGGLRKLLPRNIGVVVIAEVSNITSVSNMGVGVCRVTGNVTAYATRSGELVASTPFQNVRGFGSNWEQAKNDAYKNVGEEVADVLVGDVLSHYGEP